MKRLIVALAAGGMLAGPLAAQDQDTTAEAEQPQMCEMMHNGERMQGMMMRGDDGTMTCQMMEHGQMDLANMDHGHMQHGSMDHGQMQHGSMDHGHMGHGQAAEPSAAESQTETPQSDPAPQDHSAHEGHTPG
ncbi:hypothetical protein [Aurantiacibacter gilvus]|uniref:Copper resistance protein B n=1 Tax=Aurantiacibacter gilvus TaxID=3139141 RepID=A0ABU9IB55_9SPHN